jgi:hypothetical protein
MTSAKIRIRAAGIEIEYEGESSFLKSDLIAMLQEVTKLVPATSGGESQGKVAPANGKPATGNQSLTTKSIATKLGAKSGSEVAESAVAHLAIIREMSTFKRADINDAMKSAAGIYKVNMTSNLSKIIQTLLSQDTLVETGADTYALTPSAETRLRTSLGLG